MNTTESGATAVGAPMSIARLHQELEFYCGPSGTLRALAKTREGEALLRKYMDFSGGYPAEMNVLDAITPGAATIEIERMEYMCYGALLALQMSLVGKVNSR